MTTRRELLTAIPGLILPEIAHSKTPQSRIEELADYLAAALCTASGAQWSWKLDEKGEFLIMTRNEPAKLQ